MTDFESYPNPQTRRKFYIAYLKCKVVLAAQGLEVEIHLKNKKICSTKIKDLQLGGFGSSAGSSLVHHFENGFANASMIRL
jgi:hypothetical protein